MVVGSQSMRRQCGSTTSSHRPSYVQKSWHQVTNIQHLELLPTSALSCPKSPPTTNPTNNLSSDLAECHEGIRIPQPRPRWNSYTGLAMISHYHIFELPGIWRCTAIFLCDANYVGWAIPKAISKKKHLRGSISTQYNERLPAVMHTVVSQIVVDNRYLHTEHIKHKQFVPPRHHPVEATLLMIMTGAAVPAVGHDSAQWTTAEIGRDVPLSSDGGKFKHNHHSFVTRHTYHSEWCLVLIFTGRSEEKTEINEVLVLTP